MEFAKHVKWRSERFGAVIFDTLNEKVYVTNEPGNNVLRLLGDGLDLHAVVARLQKEYEGHEEQIQSQTAEFVGELISEGLLSPSEEERL